MKTTRLETCRVIVLGAGKSGLSKVMSIIRESGFSGTHLDVAIEYLPCVPVFDSYVNDQGDTFRYLSRVDYLGPDAAFQLPGTLLSFFDDADDDSEAANEMDELQGNRLFRGIAGMAVGSGIENGDDIDKVGQFLRTMVNAKLPVQAIQPNAGFRSMSEELTAFKSLTNEEREAATKAGTMGPAKMARFVEGFAKKLIDAALYRGPIDDPVDIVSNATSNSTKTVTQSHHSNAPLELDPTKNRYSCRKCRMMLFGDADLQDPPHVPSKHKFSLRKHDGVSSGQRLCQSYFLQAGTRWMGDMSEVEGKLSCPKCDSKVGNWSWSGAQCSCGTWVVPAIQIPHSRVDMVQPYEPDYPPGTVIGSAIQRLHPV